MLCDSMPDKKPLRVLLAGPRGFCAGVDRAIRVVEEALRRFGAPVYVRHEIVHNRYVVQQLERQGAVFVEDLAEVPEQAHVVFSAHGVPKSVPVEARRRQLSYFDATLSRGPAPVCGPGCLSVSGGRLRLRRQAPGNGRCLHSPAGERADRARMSQVAARINHCLRLAVSDA